MHQLKKVVLIGFNGLNSDLVYQWKNELHNLNRVMNHGIFGKIKSPVPPTIPLAWSCILCGKNPGHFGFWDYTYRDDYQYGQPKQVSSKVRDERVQCLYNILPAHGKKMAMINVPVTYPPPKISNGYCISSSSASDIEKQYTSPDSLIKEIKEITGEYITDVPVFAVDVREVDKKEIVKKIYKMDKQRFDLTKFFLKDKNCDLVFTVITGTGRISHLFYRYIDTNHTHKDAVKNHYKLCDENIGEILSLVDKNTSIIITGDYGIQRSDGRINVNEWLIQEGYMTLRSQPTQSISLLQADIDWNRTRAWATGCFGQVYLNVKGREPQGIVDPYEYDKVLDELGDKIKNITSEDSEKLDIKVIRRKDIHPGEYSRFGPDLFICFENYHWNTNDHIGFNSIYSNETHEDPDNVSHAPYSFFAITGPGVRTTGKVSNADLLDIAPTLLHLLGLPVPADMEGEVLIKEESVHSGKDKKELRERLARLGYLG